MTFAEETAAKARDGLADLSNLVTRYLRAVDDINEISQANARLQAALAEERKQRHGAERNASKLADELTAATTVITQLQGGLQDFVNNPDERAEPPGTTAKLQKLLDDTRNTFAEDDEDAPALRDLMDKARREGRIRRTAAPWEAVPLGVCPGCSDIVYSGQKFNMHRLSWGADFAGDDPGERLVFTHREHGNGDHSKDGG